MSFSRLFDPIDVGPIALPNRIMSSANFSGLSEENLPSERLAYYHGEKARGGVGVTILEEMPVSPSTRFALPASIFAFDRRSIPGFRLLTDRVHHFRGAAFGQLIHRGAHAFGFDPRGLAVKKQDAPSQLPSLVSPDGYSVPHEISLDQIGREVEFYGATASNLVEANFDGIEIKCDSSSLPIQFLSPLTNHRNDEYGGSLANRLRFLDLVISEIYKVTNGKRALGIKMPGDEFVPGGLKLEDMQQVARHIENSGKVDYISIGAGNLGFDPDYNTPSAYYEQGLFVHLAEGIKKSISGRVKVAALGRITEPAFADSVISSGKADMVMMMRALIADPELPNKARDGRTTEIIPCIGCNQGCLGHVLSFRPTCCILNPATSREKEWGIGTLKSAYPPKNILVISAGPAGIEFSKIAAARGHKVTVLERSSSIGGQTRLASLLPGRKEFVRAIRYWQEELKRLGVMVKLNHQATLKEILGSNSDVVVFATGASERPVGFSPAFSTPEGVEFIRDSSEISNLNPGSFRSAVVYDDRGDFYALGWSELLLEKGAKRVTILTRNPTVGQFVEPWTKFTANKRLQSRGVKFVGDSYLRKVTADSVTYYNIYSNEETTVDSEQTYFVSWPKSEDELLREFSKSAAQTQVYSIGDCVSPRSVEEAVFEGHKLAREI